MACRSGVYVTDPTTGRARTWRGRVVPKWAPLGLVLLGLLSSCTSASPASGTPSRGTSTTLRPPVSTTPSTSISTSAPSTSSSTSTATRAPTPSSLVTEAMAAVSGHTTAPLWAPTEFPGVPPGPGSGAVVAGTPYLSGQTSVTETSYQVSLFFTSTPQPLNGGTEGAAEADMYATFGTSVYDSASAATGQMDSGSSPSCASEETATTIDKVSMTSCASPCCSVSWAEGDWDFYIGDPTRAQTDLVASTILAFTRDYLLPPWPGRFLVGQGADPGTSMLTWQMGDSLIQLSSVAGQATVIGEMARSMRPYPPAG